MDPDNDKVRVSPQPSPSTSRAMKWFQPSAASTPKHYSQSDHRENSQTDDRENSQTDDRAEHSQEAPLSSITRESVKTWFLPPRSKVTYSSDDLKFVIKTGGQRSLALEELATKFQPDSIDQPEATSSKAAKKRGAITIKSMDDSTEKKVKVKFPVAGDQEMVFVSEPDFVFTFKS